MSDAVRDARSHESDRSRGEAAHLLYAGLAFAAIVFVLFADIVFGDAILLPSHGQGDTARYFLWQRLFVYSELAAGNIPLWNPYTFSGAPCVGIFQSAVFYPPNLFYLLMQVREGLIFELALHLLLLALFSFAWLRGKGITPLSSFLAATTVILGATCSLRVLAGQLSVLDTFAWWPLLLLAIDRLALRASLGWTLAGIGATTLMILAGHPPTVLMAGAATLAYAVPIVAASPARVRLLARLALLGVAPLLLSAVQLFTGLHTAAEGVRSGGMSYAFATSHSFPPEQMLTLLAPEVFGNASLFHKSFFGRVFFWDATLYLGLAAGMLALHGALVVRGRQRNVALALSLLFCLTAMGGYTPLYALFYHALPGFSFVRAPSKFLFFAAVFASLLIGMGLDRLASDPRGARRIAGISAGLCVLLAALALWTFVLPADSESVLSPQALLGAFDGAADFKAEGDPAVWRALMLRSFVISAVVAGLAAPLLLLAPRRRRWVWLLVLLAVADLLLFARMNRGTTRMTEELDLRPRAAEAYRLAGETRVIETAAPSNIAVARRNYALWGYDPVVLGRYVRFMAFTQGKRMEELKNPTLLQLKRFHPLLSMLRGRYQIMWQTHEMIDHPGALPRMLLLGEHRVVADEAAVLAAIGEPGFDPRHTVVLEQEPVPPPEPRPAGARPTKMRVLAQSSDHVDVELEVERPQILLMTDAYSRGWRALALPGSAQASYQLLPANSVLRAIPLAAGSHRLRIEYSPLAYRVGAWVSASSFAVFAGALGFALLRRFTRGSPAGA